MFEKYRLPIYILENGIADVRDEKRGRFIKDHLKQVADAINVEGFPSRDTTTGLCWTTSSGEKVTPTGSVYMQWTSRRKQDRRGNLQRSSRKSARQGNLTTDLTIANPYNSGGS